MQCRPVPPYFDCWMSVPCLQICSYGATNNYVQKAEKDTACERVRQGKACRKNFAVVGEQSLKTALANVERYI